ncbi:MAG: sugar isomerase [Cyclobacteriaceae bacterium]
MRISKDQIADFNKSLENTHIKQFSILKESLQAEKVQVDDIITKLRSFQIAIPSWALGTGGTRFGRFPEGGEPRNLNDKLQDVGLIHALNRCSGAISLHIPWDVPEDFEALKTSARELDLEFDAVNSNTFQDQPGQQYSYKHGSISSLKDEVRKQAVAHNIDVIKIGEQLGSKALTIWLADGSNFPGQVNFRKQFAQTLLSLEEIYRKLPADWKMLIEYKPYEPNFYSMVIPDWGTSFSLAGKLGEKAYTLVDLGHHLPNTNIEQIVSILMMEEKLGGFHFNDSKYGDDDLTVGSLKPYQLFLIFAELVSGRKETNNPSPAWMIDASHNLKDPIEDLLQSTEAILIAYAQALLLDFDGLENARLENDAVRAQQILQDSFRTDVRPLVNEAVKQNEGCLSPIGFYRTNDIRQKLKKERGDSSVATGL